MIRLTAAALLAVLLQDAIEIEAKFRATLDRVERIGLTVPDLPSGAAELDAIHSKTLPKDLRDRYLVVRAQAAVLASLHATLLKSKGTQVEIPIPPGKPVKVTLVDVLKRGVKFSRAEGTQELAYAELDPEWCLATAKPTLAADAALLAGLWLAKAARWEAAFVALGTVESDHPLAVEARKRGIDAAVQGFGSLIKSRRWTDALSRLEALEQAGSGDARLATLRTLLLDGMVEYGKELCRKKSKAQMNEMIDLITKNFPDAANRIDEIREANRWIKITDPKRFRPEGVFGGSPPWLLDSGTERAKAAYLTETPESFVGLSIRIRFEKDSAAQGGLLWEGGSRIVWISARNSALCVAAGKAGTPVESYKEKPVTMTDTHRIVLKIQDGHYVITYNGEEFDRVATTKTKLDDFGLNSAVSKTWYDEVWLLKKE